VCRGCLLLISSYDHNRFFTHLVLAGYVCAILCLLTFHTVLVGVDTMWEEDTKWNVLMPQ
jgi:hypothetical protein